MNHEADPNAESQRKIALARIAPSTEERASEFAVETHTDDLSLRDRLAIMRRHFLVILGVGALITGARAYQLAQAVPAYRAQSTVRFNDSRSNLTAGVGTEASRTHDWTVDANRSQTELLSSRAVTEEAVDNGKLQLRELPKSDVIGSVTALDAAKLKKTDTLRLKFADSVVSASLGKKTAAAPYGSSLVLGDVQLTMAARPSTDSARFVVIPREDAISTLQGVSANLRKETDIADLTFQSPDPVFAERAVNAATLSFQTLSIRSAQQGAKARRKFIESQLRKADSVLEVQRAQLSAFRSASQAYSSKDKIAAEQQSLASIEMRGAELEADRQVYQSLLARAVNASSGETQAMRALMSAPGIAANPVIAQVYSQLVQLYRSRDSLTTGPFASAGTNPDVQRLNALIQSTNDELTSAVKSQIEGLDARIASLKTMGARSAAQVSALPRTEAEESRLLRETEGTQKLAEQLREEEQRARISEVAQGGQVEVIDLARLPGHPVDNGRSRKLLFAAILGLLIGTALAFLIDGMNTSLRSLEDVGRNLQLPTLGVIPSLAGADKSGRKIALLAKGGGNGKHAARLVNASAPAFESFRTLRTSLIFSNAVQSLKTIVVSSAAPGDGKSTTTANLAAAFAQQGMRVLAIDCDFRRGRLHSFFGFSRSPGLTNVILGQTDLASAIHQTSTPNLSLLTAGTHPPNASELLGSEAVRRLLGAVAGDYDLVIIDSPPILATADAAILSSIVDGVLLLVRMGVTDRHAAQRALQRLEVVGARVLGTVLNDPDNVLGSAEEYYYSYAAES